MFLFRWPSRADWLFSALVMFGFAIVAAPIALISGIYNWSPDILNSELLRVALIALLLPAFLEEMVFRGPLLGIQNQRGHVPIWIVLVSLIAFVSWHPINAVTFMPQAASTFLDSRFLASVTLFGAAANIVTLRTRSLWPAMGFHWLLVVSWKGLFGAPSFL